MAPTFSKFWTRESARVGETELFEEMVRGLPESDATFVLDIQRELAMSRKRVFESSETEVESDSPSAPACFVKFKLRVGIEVLRASHRWTRSVTRISVDQPPMQVAIKTAAAVSLSKHQEGA